MRKEVTIQEGYRPGAIGRVAAWHGLYYHRHWNFGLFFEAKVATELSAFLQRYRRGTDGFWLAMDGKKMQGSLIIDGLDAETSGAHLRWFIVADALRGGGAGRMLLETGVAFCRKNGFPSVHLWTFEGLHAARHLYESVGFRLVAENTGSQWGTEVTEQYFEMAL
jgi:GNAT superfamily N-acetyltransferase